ncbi:hypothetical protein [Candidatus Pantoea persica]|uniref:hypothetical protein n=1 Tax=Candidatus Pantoea persica TaxID=2518128 RepID=UPI00215DBD35|nr:hypothetical protein [Candidatus Pantoea persica]MBA2816356.1 hypothetical protein [Candidatus Pantoea persica]
MALFRYDGPPSGVTLRTGEVLQEVLLWPGREVKMPEDHEYTQTLVCLGYLTRLDAQPVYLEPAARPVTSRPAATPSSTEKAGKQKTDSPSTEGEKA